MAASQSFQEENLNGINPILVFFKIYWRERGGWQYFEMRTMVPLMKSWVVQKLMINWNFQPSIIKQIQMIGFPTLRILHLGTNQIQTAEGIERIEMKNLYYINLGNNDIVSFRCIRKAYWPNLKNFLFRHNHINDLSGITQMNLSIITLIWIQSYMDDNNQDCTIKWLFKTSYETPRKIMVNSRQRLLERTIMSILRKKYSTISMETRIGNL